MTCVGQNAQATGCCALMHVVVQEPVVLARPGRVRVRHPVQEHEVVGLLERARLLQHGLLPARLAQQHPPPNNRGPRRRPHRRRSAPAAPVHERGPVALDVQPRDALDVVAKRACRRTARSPPRRRRSCFTGSSRYHRNCRGGVLPGGANGRRSPPPARGSRGAGSRRGRPVRLFPTSPRSSRRGARRRAG